MITIDYAAHPHIVEAIALASPTSVQVAFRGLSRRLKELVDPLIFEHVVVPDRPCGRRDENERGGGPYMTLMEGLDGPLPMVWKTPHVPPDHTCLSHVKVIDYRRYVYDSMRDLWSVPPSEKEGIGKTSDLVVRRFGNLPHATSGRYEWYAGAHTLVDFFNLSAANDHEVPIALTPQDDDIVVRTRVHHYFYDPLHPRAPDITIHLSGRAGRHVVIFTAHSPRVYPDSTPVVPAKDVSMGILGDVVRFFGEPKVCDLWDDGAGNDHPTESSDDGDDSDDGQGYSDDSDGGSDSDSADHDHGFFIYLVPTRYTKSQNTVTFVGLTEIDRRLVGLPLTASDSDVVDAIRAAMKNTGHYWRPGYTSWRDRLVDSFAFVTHEEYRAAVGERTYRLHTWDPETTIVPPPPLTHRPCPAPSPLATAPPEEKYRFLTVFADKQDVGKIQLRGPSGEDIGLEPLVWTDGGIMTSSSWEGLEHTRVLEIHASNPLQVPPQWDFPSLQVARFVAVDCWQEAPTVALFWFATPLDGLSSYPNWFNTARPDAQRRVVINIVYDPARADDVYLMPLEFTPHRVKQLVIVFAQFDSWPTSKPLTVLCDQNHAREPDPNTVLAALVCTLGREAPGLGVTVVGVAEFCTAFNLHPNLDPDEIAAYLTNRTASYIGSDEEKAYFDRHPGCRDRARFGTVAPGLAEKLRFMTHAEYEAEVGAEMFQWETHVPPVEVFRRVR